MNKIKLAHTQLVDLLQKAYSAELAAAFAYQGHAGSTRNKVDKEKIRQIEFDEWNHRTEVLKIMHEYNIPISMKYERRFWLIGRGISISCYLIGWFMPYYFAGSLESGNVCEYFRMKHFFNDLGIFKHDEILYEMGIKEKEHEVYFLAKIKDSKLLPLFETIFRWGNHSFNNVDLAKKYPIEQSGTYCRK
jgi:hypothetical protein